MNGFVQRLKQLHLLIGILVGWLLLLIIFSGSLSFYRAELDQLQLFKLNAAPELTSTASSAAVAQHYLAQYAPAATQWYIELPQPRKPYLTLHWLQPLVSGSADSAVAATRPDAVSSSQTRPQLYQQLLNAKTGQPLTAALPVKFGATEHQLGGLFFQLHYNLLQLFGSASRSLVGYAALLWLLLSVAGVLSLRGRWLTLWQFRPLPAHAVSCRTLRHNQLAVLTLPFALLFASSGWVTQMFSDNQAPQRQLYPDNPYQFYSELFPSAQPFVGERQDDPAPLPDLAAQVAAAEQHFGQPVGKISLTQPGTIQSTVLLTGSAAAQVSNQLPNLLFKFETVSWQQQKMTAVAASTSPIALSRSFWYGLHQSLYAEPWLRFGLFVSGMLCCWMIWLGLRSWLQRQPSRLWAQLMLPVTALLFTTLVVGSLLLLAIQLLPETLLSELTVVQQWLTSLLIIAALKLLLARYRY